MSDYNEEDYLQLSGLQHFLFCRRQWALIHMEGLWAENVLTVGGEHMHERAHDESLTEKRGDTIITRSVPVCSRKLGVSGKCDVVEFRMSKDGIMLFDREGRYAPFPIEYKHGEPKGNDCDRAQLCLQAMCLEEMLCCTIDNGALFYGATKRREQVNFDAELRNTVTCSIREMHEIAKRGYTPKGKRRKACASCSIKELCLPGLLSDVSVHRYLEENL